jgi:hypothetical protein
MPQQLTFSMSGDMLIVGMQIAPPTALLQASLAGGPSPLTVTSARALIDTGAEATSISPDVAARLGLASSGRVQMTTASGTAMVERYQISFSIFDARGVAGPSLTRQLWNVTSFPQPLTDIEALIGMDVIKEVSLKIDGPGKVFTLEF